MIGVVVVTHGQLATELLNATEMIVGDLPQFAAVSIGWHDEVNDALPPEMVTSEQIDDLMELLEGQNIEVVVAAHQVRGDKTPANKAQRAATEPPQRNSEFPSVPPTALDENGDQAVANYGIFQVNDEGTEFVSIGGYTSADGKVVFAEAEEEQP